MDHVTKARRSTIMSAIRGKHTVPEMLLRSAAHRMGLRFRLHTRQPGRPDLVLKKWNTAVFVNGCFWHRHEGCKRTTLPKTNAKFWEKKFETNVERDAANYAQLRALGWRVIVIWQCQIPNSEKATKILKHVFRKRRETLPFG
jgi:DNA mismatch endonuclease (patch repair protein)